MKEHVDPIPDDLPTCQELLRATTTTGSDRTLEAIPVESVREILNRHALDR